METKTTDGLVGNLTGVLAEIGIGAALLAVGFARRSQTTDPYPEPDGRAFRIADAAQGPSTASG
jgi:hypothetical protein